MVFCAGFTYLLIVTALGVSFLAGYIGGNLPDEVISQQVLSFAGPVIIYYTIVYALVVGRVSWFSAAECQAVLLLYGSKLTCFDRYILPGVTMVPYPAAVQLLCFLIISGLNLLRLAQGGQLGLNPAYVTCVLLISIAACMFLCGLTLRTLWCQRAAIDDYPYDTPTLFVILYWNLYSFQFRSLYDEFMQGGAQPTEQKVDVNSIVFVVAYAVNYAAVLLV